MGADGRSRRFIQSCFCPHALLPPTGTSGPPIACEVGPPYVLPKDLDARLTQGPASLSTAERHQMTLPTMKQSDLAINALMQTPRTPRKPQRVGRPMRSRTTFWHTEWCECTSQTSTLHPGIICDIDSVMRTRAFSATPTLGRMWQATDSHVIRGIISARRRCKRASGLEARVVSRHFVAKKLFQADPSRCPTAPVIRRRHRRRLYLDVATADATQISRQVVPQPISPVESGALWSCKPTLDCQTYYVWVSLGLVATKMRSPAYPR